MAEIWRWALCILPYVLALGLYLYAPGWVCLLRMPVCIPWCISAIILHAIGIYLLSRVRRRWLQVLVALLFILPLFAAPFFGPLLFTLFQPDLVKNNSTKVP